MYRLENGILSVPMKTELKTFEWQWIYVTISVALPSTTGSSTYPVHSLVSADL